MLSIGIDIGSNTTKAALIKDRRVLAAVALIPTGYNVQKAGQAVYQQVLQRAGIEGRQMTAVVATGYGRNHFAPAHKAITEITCHAVGACFLDPLVRTIIDIGGQDAKVLVVDSNGRVSDFVMNDKCAAGTGRFLEVMARALEVDLAELGVLAAKAARIAPISSLCTVFAESEVISLISVGEERASIIAGIHASVAGRVAAMGRRLQLQPPIMMTGGVAGNQGVVQALEVALGHTIRVDPKAQYAGAIGAALLA